MVEGGGDQISRIWGCKWKDISVELMNSPRFKCQSNNSVRGIWIKDVLTDSRRHSKHTRTNRINDEKCRTNRFTAGWKGSRIKRGVKLFDQKYNDTFQSLYFRRKFRNLIVIFNFRLIRLLKWLYTMDGILCGEKLPNPFCSGLVINFRICYYG